MLISTCTIILACACIWDDVYSIVDCGSSRSMWQKYQPNIILMWPLSSAKIHTTCPFIPLDLQPHKPRISALCTGYSFPMLSETIAKSFVKIHKHICILLVRSPFLLLELLGMQQ